MDEKKERLFEEKTSEELMAGNKENWVTPTYKWKEALEFAKLKHEGQTRDEGTPYFEHIKGTMDILVYELKNVVDENSDYDFEEVLMVTALHDVLEDTDCTYEELEEKFGTRVAKCVNLLTRKEGQSFDDYAKSIFENEEFPYAKTIKLADRLHNLRSLPKTNKPEKMYKKIKETERCILPYENISDKTLVKKINEELESLRGRPDMQSFFSEQR